MQQFIENVKTYFVQNWPSLLKFVVVLIVGFFAIKIIVNVVRSATHRSTKISNMAGDFLSSIVKVTLIIIYAIALLSLLGIPTTSLVALFSAFGLAVSLAMQNSLSNFAGGFIITATRPFEEGDYVEIGSTAGTVREITIACTKLTTPDNKVIVIPNSTVSSATITNYSAQSERRVDWTFSAAYGSDVEKVKETILSVINSHPLVLQDEGHAPMSRLKEHAASSLNFVARAWVKSGDYWTVYFDVNEQILKAFEEAGIEVPFDQLDVHITK